MGVAFARLGKDDKALENLEKAIAIDGNMTTAHLNIGGIFFRQKNFIKAAAAFETALKTGKDNIVALYHLGLSRYYLKEYRLAAESLEKTVSLAPNHVNAQLNLAILYYQHLGKPEKSIAHFMKTLELKPDVTNAKEIKKIISQLKASAKL